jgi:hypothetical protein
MNRFRVVLIALPALILLAACGSSTSATRASDAATSSTSAASETSVELWHCGVRPVEFDGERWSADPPPFDATNAPEGFSGRGRIVRVDQDSAQFTDSGTGARIEFKPLKGAYEPPPCA